MLCFAAVIHFAGIDTRVFVLVDEGRILVAKGVITHKLLSRIFLVFVNHIFK